MRRTAVLIVPVVVAAALTSCTSSDSTEPDASTTTAIPAVSTTAPPVETTVATTATPVTTAPATTTIVVPAGPPVAPGAIRVTLGDTYVVTDDVLAGGNVTFDIYNGGAGAHSLAIVSEQTDETILESDPLGPQEWIILDVALDPGSYTFVTDAELSRPTARFDVTVTG